MRNGNYVDTKNLYGFSTTKAKRDLSPFTFLDET